MQFGNRDPNRGSARAMHRENASSNRAAAQIRSASTGYRGGGERGGDDGELLRGAESRGA